ncbi:hypothetical protein EZI54_11485 [Marinobacter halodurans]|uniref:Uncharacterized protein n=1 Tax=Marinobacter halodurans TaxID=2528979 RepID=A0ABY1ZJQ4_9GAMM|nr:hypothetical protein [Marinobacter halodurans]TBW55442.1 hypothetical protein EZI54_11485 [Marinobacter halodurans]
MKKQSDWSREYKAVRAVQMAFDLSSDIQRAFRVAAVMQDLTPSDMVRKVLGLSYRKKRIRPRLTVTLHEEDFVALAARYDLSPEDRAAIRERVSEELGGFARTFLPDHGD